MVTFPAGKKRLDMSKTKALAIFLFFFFFLVPKKPACAKQKKIVKLKCQMRESQVSSKTAKVTEKVSLGGSFLFPLKRGAKSNDVVLPKLSFGGIQHATTTTQIPSLSLGTQTCKKKKDYK